MTILATTINEQDLLLGLARSSRTADPEALAGLALLGQRRRFDRLAIEAAPSPLDLAGDPWPILPEAARRLFLRLFLGAGKAPADGLEEAAISALEAARFRLHPFDFHGLEPLIVRHAARLGATAASWLTLVRSKLSVGGKAVGDQIARLRALRERDPDLARTELAAAFSGYPAAQRLELLYVLLIGLGQGDIDFLTSLAADKASTIREHAADLLARIRGTDAYTRRLAKALDYLKVQTTGLVFKKKTLVVHGMTPASGTWWQILPGLRLDDLATALGLDVRALIEQASGIDGLEEIMLDLVLAERRYDLVPQFNAQRRADGADWIMRLYRLLLAASGAEREALLAACIHPELWSELPIGALAALYEAWGGPLPEAMARRLLDSQAWQQMVRTAAADPRPSSNFGVPEALATLIPVTFSRRFIAEGDPVSRRAADYHRFLLALAKEAP